MYVDLHPIVPVLLWHLTIWEMRINMLIADSHSATSVTTAAEVLGSSDDCENNCQATRIEV